MDTRPYTCCFTGHQNLPIHQQEEIWQRVCTRLYPLLERDVRYFGVGGAIGFDTLVAEKLLNLRKTYPQIRVILVQPFQGCQSRWTPAQQARAAAVENRADKVVICCRTPSREAFLARGPASGGWICLLYWLLYPFHRRHSVSLAVCTKARAAGVEHSRTAGRSWHDSGFSKIKNVNAGGISSNAPHSSSAERCCNFILPISKQAYIPSRFRLI